MLIEVRNNLAFLRTDYISHTIVKSNPSGEPSTSKLSLKTLFNFWITFSTFFGWAATEFKIKNTMVDIPGLKYITTPATEFSYEDIDAIIKYFTHTHESNLVNRHNFAND